MSRKVHSKVSNHEIAWPNAEWNQSHPIVLALHQSYPPDFSGTIVDLGSGFGTMVRALKKHAPKATVIGIEKAFIPYIISKILLTPHIRYGDFTSSFPQGDLFYAYLYPGGMDKLPRDIPLISLAFAQRQRKPEKVLEVGVLQPTKIYVYK